MINIKILDCTLRDGGYINDWRFGKANIKEIIDMIAESKVDIIECGFLRCGDEYNDDSTSFVDINDVISIINPKHHNSSYALMIENNRYISGSLPRCNHLTPEIIRVTFRKNERDIAIKNIAEIIELGYKVCVQPVGFSNYSEDEILSLINKINNIHPYAFYIVDTLGTLYPNELINIFDIVHKYLDININIGFHSHNNLQLSFANSIKFIESSCTTERKIIIDTSCYGMGRGAGNLPTELLADYLNKNFNRNYFISPILDIIEKFLMPIFYNHSWGYSTAYFLSSVLKCHPNYSTFLTKKDNLTYKNIYNILNLIESGYKYEFDKNYINTLYTNFQSNKYDDTSSLKSFRKLIKNKKILILAPGPSVYKNHDAIADYIKTNNAVVISVNFKFNDSCLVFCSNQKRFDLLFKNDIDFNNLLITSNLFNLIPQHGLIFDYESLIGVGEGFDNAGAMLIRLIKRANISEIALAGFDGFEISGDSNYFDNNLKRTISLEEAKQRNDIIGRQLKNALEDVKYNLLFETKYGI